MFSKVRQVKMKFLIVLALVFAFGSCKEEDNNENLEKLRLLSQEQFAIFNASINVANTFSVETRSVVNWRRIVNNKTLCKDGRKSVQVFLDYVRHTFKFAEEIWQENAFSYGRRFFNFETFLMAPDSLTEKQLCKVSDEISNALKETSKQRKHIEQYISNENEKIEEIKANVEKLRRILAAFGVRNETIEIEQNLFDTIKRTTNILMGLLTSSRMKNLSNHIQKDIKKAVKIENKLVKTLDKISLTADFHHH